MNEFAKGVRGQAELVIDARGLHKRFTEGSGDDALDVHVLQGVDLAVKRGETVAIVIVLSDQVRGGFYASQDAD